MNISDLENANKAAKILDRIDKAIQQAKTMKMDDADVGGIPGVAEYGYNAVVSKYRDGSGSQIDLNGCYVGNDIAESIIGILQAKRNEVLGYLTTIGVNIDDRA